MNNSIYGGLSEEELVRQGYVVIVVRGCMKQYVPTDKYRAALGRQPTEQAMVLHNEYGVVDYDPEEVYCICGECGQDLYPICGCPTVPPSASLLLATFAGEGDEPLVEVVVDAEGESTNLRLHAPTKNEDGRYRFVATDIPVDDTLPQDRTVRQALTLRVKGRRYKS